MLPALGSHPSLLDLAHLYGPGASSSSPQPRQDKPAPAARDAQELAPAALRPDSSLYAMLQVEIESTRSIQFANGARITEHLQMSYLAETALSAYGHNGPSQENRREGQFTALLSLQHQMTMEGPVTQDQIDFFQDYFSPEKTAERIGSFALSGFSGNPTDPAARSEWREYILPAVVQGFEAAKKQLGNLPEELDRTITDMLDSIKEMLDRFVSQGLLPGASKLLPEKTVTPAPLSSPAPLPARA